ncbi:MAG: alternative ribosome rescue aminoacyl-tRNA hydrolase ArfB [Phycisphaerae bacterium]|nr:alternative ribosome rescue aminoacyl-tRNA hydrolase ArfB [Phycisphaerae bacterium]
MEDLYINPRITIPSDCFTVSYSRSSGPGGQHVNKLNTRVSVFLDIRHCPCFSERQKQTLAVALKGRIDKQGVLQVSSQQSRSQAANRNAALQRMAELIGQALKPKRTRKKTHVPKRAVEKRLSDKKSRSNIKRLRSEKPQEE